VVGRKIRCAAASAAALLPIAIVGLVLMRPPSWADEFSSSGLGIDGPPTLAGPEPNAGSANALAEVDPSTGAVRASLAFQLLVARGRAQPSLALTYSSAVGVGSAGVGWSLNLPSIERKGATAFAKFVDDPAGADPASVCSPDVSPPNPKAARCADRFVLAGQALVPVCIVKPPPPATADLPPFCEGALRGEVFPASLIGWTYFRTEIDDGNRVFWSPNHETWIVQTHAGVTSYFGRPLDLIPSGHGLEHADALFRVADPNSPGQGGLPTDVSDIYRWNLVRQFDPSGNVVVFMWDTLASDLKSGVEGMQFLTDIFDTPLGTALSIIADYAHHTHLRWSAPDFSNGALVQTPVWRSQPPLRLVGVDVTSKSTRGDGPRELVRRYHLDYTWNFAHTRAFLTSFQMEGRCPGVVVENSQGLLPPTTCVRHPAKTLEYTTPPLVPEVIRTESNPSLREAIGPIALKDAFGDARPSPMYLVKDPHNPIFVGQIPTVPEYRPSAEGRVARAQDIAPGAPHAVFGDFIHDRRVDVLFANPGDSERGLPPSYENYALGKLANNLYWLGQGPFALPAFSPPTSWQPDPSLFAGAGRLLGIDIDGDGLTDLLLPDDNGWRAYLSALDSQGTVQPFAERPGRTCVPHEPATGAQMRLMADFDGDGLTDFIELEDVPPPHGSTRGVWAVMGASTGILFSLKGKEKLRPTAWTSWSRSVETR
jgi:Salmonella virulence plasmid 65kDa B protein